MFSHHSHFLETCGGGCYPESVCLLVPLSSVQVFRTCARADTAASVSHPVSHNEEKHSLDVFTHTAFVYMFTVSGCAHHVKDTAETVCIKHEPGQRDRKPSKIYKFKMLCFLSSLRLSSKVFHSLLHIACPLFEGSRVGGGSLEAWWFSERGGTMFCLHELPVNLLIKHANSRNCSW